MRSLLIFASCVLRLLLVGWREQTLAKPAITPLVRGRSGTQEVLFGTDSGLEVFDVRTSTFRDRLRMPEGCHSVVDGGALCGNTVVVFDPSPRRLRLRDWTPTNSSRLVAVEPWIFVADNGFRVTAFNPVDGTLEWIVARNGEKDTKWTVELPEFLVAETNGKLITHSVGNGRLLAVTNARLANQTDFLAIAEVVPGKEWQAVSLEPTHLRLVRFAQAKIFEQQAVRNNLSKACKRDLISAVTFEQVGFAAVLCGRSTLLVFSAALWPLVAKQLEFWLSLIVVLNVGILWARECAQYRSN